MNILVTGDIATWNQQSFCLDNLNPEYKKLLQESDLNIFNLEGPIIGSGLSKGRIADILFDTFLSFVSKDQPKVFSDRRIFDILRLNKSVVTLANNHLRDFGEVGIVNTLRLLKEQRVEFLGVESLVNRSRNFVSLENSVVILNYNFTGSKYGINLYKLFSLGYTPSSKSVDKIHKEVEKYQSQGKKVLLILHAGKQLVEDYSVWKPSLQEIKKIRADVTVVHHPHTYVKTPYEVDNIFVLGDFIFNFPEYLPKNRQTAVLKVSLRGSEIKTVLVKDCISNIFRVSK